jgi:RND family efflux transporter MFP subunit
MSTEPLEPQQPAGSPLEEPPAKPPRPFARRMAGCLQRLRGQVAAPLQRLDWRVVGMVLLAVSSIPVWRAVTVHAKPQVVLVQALPVAVARVTREDLTQELVCDAELRPYQEIDLHAKVAGYLQTIKVDIGDRVKAGQLLATLEVPELLDELHNAMATEQKAEADYTNAHRIYGRLAAVNKQHPNLVAQQELDTADAKDRTTAASIAASKADVAKYNTLEDYTRITAPFDGVITKRYADPGALIQAGTASSTQTLPLVRLSQNDRLRLDIPVSVSYVSRVKVGDPVEIRVDSYGTTLTGTIARSTRKVETATRTMEVEVDVPNADLRLIPGMYASVVLRLEHREKALVVPVEAVSRQKSCTVFVVDKEGKIEERTISLGLETPRKIEVLAGLNENDLVMIGSRTQVKPGQKVEPKLIAVNTAE